MNTEALFVFLILLLGLVLCSFLGGKEGFENSSASSPSASSSSSSSPPASSYSDYYNHFTGNGSVAQLQNGMVFTDPSGNTITVVVNSDGSNSLKLVSVGQPTPMILTSTKESPMSFAAPYGGVTATVVTDSNGLVAVQVSIQGHIIVFSQPTTNNSNSTTTSSTQYYGSTGYPIQPSPYALAYQGPNGGSTSGYDYSSSMPPGIPKSQIPPGHEDLYILKSEIVPPVCPVCPASSACPRQEKCPPCPACARCPEPSFECKKVPNYNAINSDVLPVPVLNDFSQFGM